MRNFLQLHIIPNVLTKFEIGSVVLMDELDQLVTAKKDDVYDFFNWPNFSKSKLVVIAVSNTHDLPDRVMPAKVLSRMGKQRVHSDVRSGL